MGNNFFDLHDLYQNAKNDKIIFYYCGPISQATIEGIGHTLRLDLEIEETRMSVSQSIFSVFIEQMQNILNYSVDRIVNDVQVEKELRVGVLVIGQEDQQFYVYCGNKIFNEDVKNIQDKINEISGLQKEELKALYRKRRKMELPEGSKGAGLGLIEMARKSGKPLQYSFEQLDEEFSFFTIKVTVSRR
ncbi:SiaB family protein kinase [Clostridium sp. WILCCON 0269]|uniref:SiaB family protein kinase n=1 Tax=Candidatus Clostridium eludens TaxID=3381663 RepID=A0ABW8SJC9_9CLOT